MLDIDLLYSVDASYHMAEKLRMVRFRNAVDRRGLCDLCGGKFDALDKHEIIHKSRTVKGSEDRKLSESTPLCSLLCRQCHSRAHKEDIAADLLSFNFKLHGVAVVLQAFHALSESAKRGIIMPEVSDD